MFGKVCERAEIYYGNKFESESTARRKIFDLFVRLRKFRLQPIFVSNLFRSSQKELSESNFIISSQQTKMIPAKNKSTGVEELFPLAQK